MYRSNRKPWEMKNEEFFLSPFFILHSSFSILHYLKLALVYSGHYFLVLVLQL